VTDGIPIVLEVTASSVEAKLVRRILRELSQKKMEYFCEKYVA
jgi:hypothetical protein